MVKSKIHHLFTTNGMWNPDHSSSGIVVALLVTTLVFCAGFPLTGCAMGEGGDSNDSDITKEQAGRMNGKNDLGQDICELQGWYGDGFCDNFCPLPDPDCEDASFEPDFHEAVAICEDRRNEALRNPPGNEAIIEAETAYKACLTQVNNTTVELIQKYADELSGSTNADVSDNLDRFRTAQDEFCNLAVSAGKFGRSGGSVEDVMIADCRAQTERELSSLIGAYLEMDMEAEKIDLDEHSVESPGCFEQYSQQIAKAGSQAAVNAALNQLNICVSKQNMQKIPAIADGLIENGKTTNEYELVVSGVETVFFASSKWGEFLCSLLSHAGPDRCPSIAGMFQGECSSALSLYRAQRIRQNL